MIVIIYCRFSLRRGKVLNLVNVLDFFVGSNEVFWDLGRVEFREVVVWQLRGSS